MEPKRTYVVGDVLSLPSGPRRDLGRPHDMLVLASDDVEALLVPICTIKPGSSGQVAVVVARDEIDWLPARSHVPVTQAKKKTLASIDETRGQPGRRTKASGSDIHPATEGSRRLAARVATRIMTDPKAPDFAKAFLLKAAVGAYGQPASGSKADPRDA